MKKASILKTFIILSVTKHLVDNNIAKFIDVFVKFWSFWYNFREPVVIRWNWLSLLVVPFLTIVSLKNAGFCTVWFQVGLPTICLNPSDRSVRSFNYDVPSEQFRGVIVNCFIARSSLTPLSRELISLPVSILKVVYQPFLYLLWTSSKMDYIIALLK